MPAVVANARELFVWLWTHRHEMRKQLGVCRGQSASSTGSRRVGASHEDHEGLLRPMNSTKMLAFTAQAEVHRILASRMFCTGSNDDDTAEHLRYAIRHVTLQGLWLEFGVSTGTSLGVIAEQTQERVYGFDSFEGLPEDWVRGEGRPTLKRGAFRGGPKAVSPHVTLVPGLFADTVPRFVEEKSEVVAFMHVDCDIYTSTRTVLRSFCHKLVPGTVIVFDELFNYPNFVDHEMRALLETAAEQGLEYEYLGYVNRRFPASSAASLQITGIRPRLHKDGVAN